MTTATPAEYGAAYLDEHDPGWASRIDLFRLDMRDSCRCVLGQLYSRGETNGFRRFDEQHGDLVARLGFDIAEDVPPDHFAETWACLNAEWSQLVASRQSTPTDPQEVTVPCFAESS